MNSPERWQKVKEILYAALEMEPADRSRYIGEKCGDDHGLRREVENLLDVHDGAEKHFESPALEMMASTISDKSRNELASKTLGSYAVLQKLGAGGMGEVYLAEDKILGRKVALKILPLYFTRDEERVRRFQQEARSASALNHPNILTIYEIKQIDSTHFIATEFIEGETLRDRIGSGPLTTLDALDVALQVGSALSAAHEAGIVHRDIKPENIMIRSDRIAKVLDFGLAKLAERPSIESEASTMVNTGEGIVMGTVQYMAPEQARGLNVDGRADIWSFGCVIYEMVTGRAPFTGPTSSDVIVSILEHEPAPVTRYSEDAPAELEWLVKKTLRKDPDERYQTAKELLSDLRSIRKRVDFESELERSSSPDSDRAMAKPFRGSGERAVVDTADQHVVRPTSSAEYLVTEIKRHKMGSLLALLVIAIGVVAAVFLIPNRTAALTEKDDILLADIINTTGDTVFDGTLKQALAVQLGQSPFLNIVSENRVRETLRRMERSADERLTAQIGREICQREGIKAFLTGSIASLGSNYVITLEAQNSQTGDALAREQVEAAGKEQVISKLGEAATKLRERLGESIASIQKFDRPLAQVTTSSLEALKAYTAGRELAGKGKDAEAIPFLLHAVELDPNFALAYHALAIAYSNPPGQPAKAEQYGTKAFELRERVTDREKFVISSMYYMLVTQEIDKSIEALELWSKTYPRDPPAYNNLALMYSRVGKYEESAESAAEGIRLNPNLAVLYGNLAWAYMALGRFDEAKTTLEEAHSRNLDSFNVHYTGYLVASAQGDGSEMQRQLEWGKGKPFESQFLGIQSWTEIRAGHYLAATEIARRSAESAQNSKLESVAAENIANLAAWGAVIGNCARAKVDTAKALEFAKGEEAPWVVLIAPAMCGDVSRAQVILDDLSRTKPKSTDVNVIWGPLCRALIEMDRGNPAEAVRVLEKSRPYEMGWGAGYWHNYIRGLAYLRQGSATNAAAEFQKIIDRRGIWPAAVHYSLAHLGIARAARMAGDTEKSRKAYNDFFILWKDADPDIPILLEATQEYAKLGE